MKLNNFGNIVKSSKKDYLKENYLSSEYTWGFELEGFVHNNLTYDDIIDDSFAENVLDTFKEKYRNGEIHKESYIAAKKIRDGLNKGLLYSDLEKYFQNDYFKEEIFNIDHMELNNRWSFPANDFVQVEDILYDTFKKYISEGNWSKMTSDGSLKPNNPNDYCFEYNTPAMPLKPSVINDVIHMFAELENTEFYINDTCGFHIHLSYPNIKRDDLIWVLCCLALDTNYLNMISYLEHSGIKLFKEGLDEYASIDVMKYIKQYLEEKNWEELSYMLSADKQTVFRIHPQGTLEWRGPRNFLNNEGDFINYKNLYDLFKNLYKLTQFISYSLNKKNIKINDEIISKQEIMKNILSQPRGISLLRSNSKIEKETWNKFSKLFSELMRNGFDEEFLRAYLNNSNKINNFIEWLKVRLSDMHDIKEIDWLYEYFKRITPNNLLYPYANEMMDCLEFLD